MKFLYLANIQKFVYFLFETKNEKDYQEDLLQGKGPTTPASMKVKTSFTSQQKFLYLVSLIIFK